jgi:hypothetical protein
MIEMSKIYVVYQEGYMSDGWIVCVGLNKLEVVKFDIVKQHNQNSLIKVYDSETMKEIYECSMLIQKIDRIDPKNWCHCPDCNYNDEVFRWIVENKVGNFKR